MKPAPVSKINQIGGNIYTGDISAILMKNLPRAVKKRRTPEEIALISDWEVKLQKLTDYAINADTTYISWCSVVDVSSS